MRIIAARKAALMLFGFLLTRGNLPVLEGTMHLLGIPLMVVWYMKIKQFAQTSAEKRCIKLHVCGMITMYAVSATLHSAFWSIEDVLFRLDQSMIFIAAAVTLSPITILLLQDTRRKILSFFLVVTTIIGIVFSLLGFTEKVGIPTASISLIVAMTGQTLLLIIAVGKNKSISSGGYAAIAIIGLIYFLGVWINMQGWLTIPRIADNNEFFHVCTIIAEWMYIRFFKRYLLCRQYQFAVSSGA